MVVVGIRLALILIALALALLVRRRHRTTEDYPSAPMIVAGLLLTAAAVMGLVVRS